MTDIWWLIGHKHFKLEELRKELHKAGFRIAKHVIFGGILSALSSYWILLWVAIVKRLSSYHAVVYLHYFIVPLYRLALRLSRLDAYKFKHKGGHIVLKCLKS
jgi:hypothetical protein